MSAQLLSDEPLVRRRALRKLLSYLLALHQFHQQKLRRAFLKLPLHVYCEQSAFGHRPEHRKDLKLFQPQPQRDLLLRNSLGVRQVILFYRHQRSWVDPNRSTN